jgi:ribulose-5-phosphate 4-epimerase/fuculose-1-phosphate aldolase
MNPIEARQEIAEASRILAAHHILDAFGHVSRRSPDRPEHFLISRSLAPAQVTPADVVELRLDGTPIEGSGPRLFLERFIHGEIYRARPDVQAIAHSHAAAVLPFTIVPALTLRPVCHMCGFLLRIPSPFDIADHAGDGTDLLIRNASLGVALAGHLANAAIVLMRGHGFTAVGRSVAEATYRAIYTAANCSVQSEAMRLGVPVYLSDAEAIACDQTASGQIDRAWNLWRSELGDALHF